MTMSLLLDIVRELKVANDLKALELELKYCNQKDFILLPLFIFELFVIFQIVVIGAFLGW